jgi:hypothetical protein
MLQLVVHGDQPLTTHLFRQFIQFARQLILSPAQEQLGFSIG